MSASLENSSIVRLNVGGKNFDTTIETLQNSPYFKALFASEERGAPTLRDSSGRIFIDRDSDTFSQVLRCMRTLQFPTNPSKLLLTEMEFFQLPVEYPTDTNLTVMEEAVLKVKSAIRGKILTALTEGCGSNGQFCLLDPPEALRSSEHALTFAQEVKRLLPEVPSGFHLCVMHIENGSAPIYFHRDAYRSRYIHGVKEHLCRETRLDDYLARATGASKTE